MQEEQEDTEDSTDAHSNTDITPWHLFGTVCPNEEIMFLCQVTVCSRILLCFSRIPLTAMDVCLTIVCGVSCREI